MSRACAECGDEFEPRDSLVGAPGQGIYGGSDQKFCSKKCRVKFRNREMYQRRLARGGSKGPRPKSKGEEN